jgi:hypothetical protein
MIEYTPSAHEIRRIRQETGIDIFAIQDYVKYRNAVEHLSRISCKHQRHVMELLLKRQFSSCLQYHEKLLPYFPEDDYWEEEWIAEMNELDPEEEL